MAEHVVVLHGLGLNRYWMWGLAAHLKRQGYIVHNVSYPSRHRTCENIVDDVLKPLIGSIPSEKIHFVVHSMGGVLVRLYAEKHGAARIARVVMLGTPNHGSEVADFLSSWRIFRYVFGDTGGEMLTKGGITERLGPVAFDCGVIAGSNHWFHFPTSWIVRKMPIPNDGLVSVESTRVDGMKDHLILWSDHSLMVWHPSIWHQAAFFLKNGRFQR